MIIDLTGLALALRRKPHAPDERPTDVPATPLLGTDDAGHPIFWPALSAEAGHSAVLASSGSGKSVAVAAALVQEIAEAPRDRLAVLIVDPKGDLIQLVLHGLAARAPQRLADTAYLDPFREQGGFPFNLVRLALGKVPLDIRAFQLAGLVASISTAVGAQKHLGVGARQIDVLQNVLLGALAVDHPRASVLLALDALTLPGGLKKLSAITTSERARQFLASAHLGDELAASCGSRLRLAVSASDALDRLVSAESCVQFEDLLAPGKVCLIDLGRPIGGLQALQAFYANLLLRLALDHLLARESPWQGHFCRVVIDEAQVVAPVLSDVAETALTTGRSKRVALGPVISQGTTLIHEAAPTLLRVLLGNTPTKVVGRLGAADAELLAREQAPGRGIDESIGEVRGRFTATVTNLADREFFLLRPGERRRFRSADVDMAAWQTAAEERAGEIEAVRSRLVLPAETAPRLTLAQPSERPQRQRGRKATTSPEGAPPRPRSRWG